jgi:uncharacterized repeat protein (TIGR01451 family)
VTATEFLTVTTSNLVTHLVQSAPNLTITKTADPPHGSPVVPGQLITYTLAVTNTGDDVAYGVVVTDVVPLYTGYAFGNSATGTITQTGGVITWTIGTLTVDRPVTATIGVTVTTPLTNGLIISNTGYVSRTGTTVITPSNTVTHVVVSSPAVTYTGRVKLPGLITMAIIPIAPGTEVASAPEVTSHTHGDETVWTLPVAPGALNWNCDANSRPLAGAAS